MDPSTKLAWHPHDWRYDWRYLKYYIWVYRLYDWRYLKYSRVWTQDSRRRPPRLAKLALITYPLLDRKASSRAVGASSLSSTHP